MNNFIKDSMLKHKDEKLDIESIIQFNKQLKFFEKVEKDLNNIMCHKPIKKPLRDYYEYKDAIMSKDFDLNNTYERISKIFNVELSSEDSQGIKDILKEFELLIFRKYKDKFEKYSKVKFDLYKLTEELDIKD